jgi:hypothetical protein
MPTSEILRKFTNHHGGDTKAIAKYLNTDKQLHKKKFSYQSPIDVVNSKLPRTNLGNPAVVETVRRICSTPTESRSLTDIIHLTRTFKEGDVFRKLTLDTYIQDIAKVASFEDLECGEL